MRKAIIYCRISRDPDHTELGVKRQERDCRDLCQRDGLQIVAVEVDDDRSAYSGRRRPGYERVLEAVRNGEVSVVVAWHPDRLTRSPRELETLIDTLEAHRCAVRTVQAGDYDLTTPAGRMTARVVGAVARGESEHKSARLRRKHQELAEQGKNSGGGPRPFGFEDDRVTIRKREADLIREAVAAVLAGGSLRSVAKLWNDKGITTTNGGDWKPSVVRRLLMSARIAGLREHTTGTYKAVWRSIISADDHHRIVAILSDPARRKNGRAVRYLLTGFLHCGKCGHRMIARPVSDGRRAYTCAKAPGLDGCGGVKTLAEPLEDLVVDAMLRATDNGVVLSTEVVEDDGIEMLAKVDRQLEELAQMWAEGELDRVSWSAARRPLEAQRDAIVARVRQTSTTAASARLVPDGATLREVWPNLDVDQRRAALGTLVEAVTLGPAVRGRNKFDPTRVSVKWRA